MTVSRTTTPFQQDNAKPAETRIDSAYFAIKNRIISGHYRPGEKLRIEQLKTDFQLSGSTLREALTKLVADRLVVAEGQRGFRVMPVSRRDLVDLSQTRILIETEALRQAIATGDEHWEARVVSAHHILNRAAKIYHGQADLAAFEEWEDRHSAFHASLVSAAPSEWLQHFLSILYRQQHRYRHMFQAITQQHPDRDAHGEHEAIFEAVMNRDSDTATRMLREHLSRTLDEWLQYFDDAGSLPPAEPDASSNK